MNLTGLFGAVVLLFPDVHRKIATTMMHAQPTRPRSRYLSTSHRIRRLRDPPRRTERLQGGDRTLRDVRDARVRRCDYSRVYATGRDRVSLQLRRGFRRRRSDHSTGYRNESGSVSSSPASSIPRTYLIGPRPAGKVRGRTRCSRRSLPGLLTCSRRPRPSVFVDTSELDPFRDPRRSLLGSKRSRDRVQFVYESPDRS